MTKKSYDSLFAKLDAASRAKLNALKNEPLMEFLADAAGLCQPQSVRVFDDSPADIAFIRRRAVELGEEKPLATTGHTIHFDGPKDQGRDKEVTRYLVPAGGSLSQSLNQIEREQGLTEIRELLRGSMAGREMIVRFFCLGPTNSPFSISCAQITDSAYVAHAEDLLYRAGYEQFKRLGGSSEFFRFVHSAGKLTDAMTSPSRTRSESTSIIRASRFTASTRSTPATRSA